MTFIEDGSEYRPLGSEDLEPQIVPGSGQAVVPKDFRPKEVGAIEVVDELRELLAPIVRLGAIGPKIDMLTERRINATINAFAEYLERIAASADILREGDKAFVYRGLARELRYKIQWPLFLADVVATEEAQQTRVTEWMKL